jgi:hypothetical protein
MILHLRSASVFTASDPSNLNIPPANIHHIAAFAIDTDTSLN